MVMTLLRKSENITPDYSRNKPKNPVFVHQISLFFHFRITFISQDNWHMYHTQGVSTKTYQTDVSAQNCVYETLIIVDLI